MNIKYCSSHYTTTALPPPRRPLHFTIFIILFLINILCVFFFFIILFVLFVLFLCNLYQICGYKMYCEPHVACKCLLNLICNNKLFLWSHYKVFILSHKCLVESFILKILLLFFVVKVETTTYFAL